MTYKVMVMKSWSDGTTGTVKVPYIGDITTLDEFDLKEKIRDQLRVEFGKVVTSVNIIGWY